jgi:hypothetical protein
MRPWPCLALAPLQRRRLLPPTAVPPSSPRSWCAGFGAAFWAAYHELLPRAPGHEGRADLYELYHKVGGGGLVVGAWLD